MQSSLFEKPLTPSSTLDYLVQGTERAQSGYRNRQGRPTVGSVERHVFFSSAVLTIMGL